MAERAPVVPDGLDEIRKELPLIVEMIARTSRWVSPEAFRALPVWYPEAARGRFLYDKSWDRIYINTKRKAEVREANIKAGKALVGALGVKKTSNWTVCHIWGIDDPKFATKNHVVQDPRFYTCIGNMVWLPTPLKGFTDASPEIKRMLRVCAFHLYGWACEHQDVASEAEAVRSGEVPQHYPESWPTADRQIRPQGTAPFSARVKKSIETRRASIHRLLANAKLLNYPRDEVRETLRFWKIEG